MRTATNTRVKYRTATGWLDCLTGVETEIKFPTATTVGVDAIPGWTPKLTITDSNYEIFDTGAVVEDIQLTNGSLIIRAPHVTVRRADLTNCTVFNGYNDDIANDLLLEDVTVRADPPGLQAPVGCAFLTASYTCNRCAVIDTNEGWHYGGSEGTGLTLMDPAYTDRTVRIYNSYARITGPPGCVEGGIDYHGDIIQAFDGGYGGIDLVVRNCALFSDDIFPECGASSIVGAGFNQSNRHDINRLILSGAATSYYNMNGGRVVDMFIEDGAWWESGFPVSIPPDRWDLFEEWQVWTCTIDDDGQVDTLTHSIPQGWNSFDPLPPP